MVHRIDERSEALQAMGIEVVMGDFANYTRQGNATALLQRLGKIALSNGVHCFVADVLA
jgi:hypothetical protein